jgi:hypothetical protein
LASSASVSLRGLMALVATVVKAELVAAEAVCVVATAGVRAGVAVEVVVDPAGVVAGVVVVTVAPPAGVEPAGSVTG